MKSMTSVEKRKSYRRSVRRKSSIESSLNQPTTDDEPSTSQAAQLAQAEKKQKALKESFKNITTAFIAETTIHGIQYLREERHHKERRFWIVLLIISMIVCGWLIVTEYLRWDKTPVILSFAERLTEVSEIPFPAITICSETKYHTTETINFTRFYYYLQKNFLDNQKYVDPPDWMSDDEFMKMRALLQVCGNYLVNGMRFRTYLPIDVERHLNELIPNFEINFLHCNFNQTTGECHSLFEKVYTEEGICYTFNGFNSTELYREDTHQYKHFQVDDHIRNRKKHVRWDIIKGFYDKEDYDTYPERVLGAGFHSGLLVVLRGLRINFDYICRGPVQGFKLTIHAPDVVPQIKKRFFLVPYEEDVLFFIKPGITTTTDNVKDIETKQRQCYYPNERYLRFFKFYNQNNCEIECIANFTLRECGCVHFSSPRLVDTKVCEVKDIPCSSKVENSFLRSEYTSLGDANKKCICLPDCWSLDYNVDVSHGTFNVKNILMGEEWLEADASRVTICFTDNEFRGRIRSEFITLTDFIGQCGGLFGVIMGGTLLIVMEFFYYLIVRFCLDYQI